MEVAEKSEEKSRVAEAAKNSVEDIKNQLFLQITKLQEQIADLKQVQQEYDRLKIRYNEINNDHQKLQKSHQEQIDLIEQEKELAAKKAVNISEAQKATKNAVDYVEAYERRIVELKETIELLEASSDTSLSVLSESIEESEATAGNIKSSIASLNAELDKYKQIIEDLENQLKNQSGETSSTKSKYTIVSKTASGKSSADGTSLESDMSDEFQALQMEVENLRNSTNTQRDIIANLEKQIQHLKKELFENSGNTESFEEKEVQLQTLEKKLTETEGCIDVLESEIEFLNEKLLALEKNPVKVVESEKTDEVEHEKDTLPESLPPISIKNTIDKIVRTTESAGIDSALENIVTELLDAIDQFDIDLYLAVQSLLGDLDVSATENWTENEKSQLKENLGNKRFYRALEGDRLLVSSFHVGIMAIPSKTTDTARPLQDYEEALSILVLVANSVIDAFEKRKKYSEGNQVFKQAVEKAREDSEKIVVQQDYQTSESQKILNNFLSDLNNSLNTMNITENQSAFFEEMIQEVKSRMELLHSSQSSVDKSFTLLINKLEKSGDKIFH